MSATVFGRLTLIEEFTGADGARMMKCRCECGKVRAYYRSNVVNGRSKSCGCAQDGKRVPPMAGHHAMSERRKKEVAANYRAGRLPRWMYS